MRPKTPRTPEATSTIGRLVSFIVLLAIVVVIGVVFFQVMAFFFVPIFLAVVLVIVFRPVHQWFVVRTRGRNRIAAGLTTVAILVIVLLPMVLVVGRAAAEGLALARGLDQETVNLRVARLRHRFKLYVPPQEVQEQLQGFDKGLNRLAEVRIPGDQPANPKKVVADLDALAVRLIDFVQQSNWPPQIPGEPRDPYDAELEKNLLKHLADVKRDLAGLKDAQPGAAFDEGLAKLQADYAQVRLLFLGDATSQQLRNLANPGANEIRTFRTWLQSNLAPAAAQALPVLIKSLIGAIIMVAAVYYFLVDGPGMLRTAMKLSPLDERYEQQLLEEFGKVSRAVVSATLLSALVQGILAGIGFRVAGVGAVFLLSVLTMVGAMVPFVGAAAVWVPTAIWLYLEGHQGAGIGLGIYGACIISLSDNVVKPYVLHGQSNLHPLLALLSVLGGVAALGPIGVFVGPMAVVFLQVVLQMLNTEMNALALRGVLPGGEKVEPRAAE